MVIKGNKNFATEWSLLNLSEQKNIFCERNLDDNMEGESQALNYCMMLMSRSPNAFAQINWHINWDKTKRYFGFAFEHYDRNSVFI